ncbi:MAG: hypothetical protein IJC88_03735 [Oscillospiraceae bacterium]|nr:hypothetical protein [Oscillospiraceae bacterium]
MIEEEKQLFLSLSWPYVYTLNIDDGIETCSEYKQVVCANRSIKSNVFTDVEENTVAIQKLHTALSSPYNSYEFAKNDSFNDRNVIGEIVFSAIADKSMVHPEAIDWLEDLFFLFSKTE